MADDAISTGTSVDGENSAARTTSARRPSVSLRRGSTGLSRIPSNSSLRQTRRLSRASVDTFLPWIPEHPPNMPEESGQWHSASLLFVALPALAGIFFENGSSVMTDVLMLALGCLFLYWSVKWPWQWYHAAQAVLHAADGGDEDSLFEESGAEDDQGREEEGDPSMEKSLGVDNSTQQSPHSKREQAKRGAAASSLQSDAHLALLACFISPPAVAFLLHTIRPYLSRPSGGVISNSTLTLFVLAAEIRPFLHLFQLVEQRTLRLRGSIGSYSPPEQIKNLEQIEELSRRIEEMELRVGTVSVAATVTDKVKMDQSDLNIEKNVRQSLQPQLDALNRAVRRYEKRATTQAMVTEARLYDLEGRLKDALSLAAAASRGHQNPGVIGHIIDRIKTLIMVPLEALVVLFFWPFRVLSQMYTYLLGPRRKKRKSRPLTETKIKPRLEQR